MTNIEKIRKEIERRIKSCKTKNGFPAGTISAIRIETYEGLLAFIDSLSEESEEETDLQDAEVIFSGHALHTDATKWADGYKLKIRIYDDN